MRILIKRLCKKEGFYLKEIGSHVMKEADIFFLLVQP